MALEQEPVAAPTPLAGQEEQDVEARPPTANEQPKESPEYSARKWSMAAKMWVSWSSIAAFFVVYGKKSWFNWWISTADNRI